MSALLRLFDRSLCRIGVHAWGFYRGMPSNCTRCGRRYF